MSTLTSEWIKSVEQSLKRELYADAPEIGQAALENGLSMLTEELAAPRGRKPPAASAPVRARSRSSPCSFRS